MPSSTRARTTTQSRRRRSSGSSSSCGKAMMGCGRNGVAGMLNSEGVYALGGETATCPKATCPAYTGVVVFVSILMLYWMSLIWAFKPTFVLKAGVPRSNPNSPEITSSLLYSLLFTALTLVIIGLIVRCRACM